MRAGAMALAWLVLLMPASTASTCEIPGGTHEGSPLRTRKPVRGEDVLLKSGFGVRLHPLLQIPKMHTGIDWAAPVGAPVIAAAGGRVISAGVQSAYGKTVQIDHGAGWQTLYAHLDTFMVKEGDCVTAEAVIGTVGVTGLTDGPAMHFEVKHNGQLLDPLVVRASDAARP